MEGLSTGEAAEKAGIIVGDRIIEMLGKPVPTLEAYIQVMSSVKSGAVLDLSLLRKGEKIKIQVKLP